MEFLFSIVGDIFTIILEIISISWWILLPLALFFIAYDFWMDYKKSQFRKKIEWVLLKIKIPQEITKTPKAMENIFSAMHSLYSSKPSFEDKFFEGKMLMWASFEMAGYAGGVDFYVRIPKNNRNLIESSVYAEYPDAEIAETEDYVKIMPEVLPNETYDIWGNDFVLAKESAYPIKTYEFFEAVLEERRLDPISAITEVMSRLKEGEAIWLQFLVRPIGDDWKKDSEAVRDKILKRKSFKKMTGTEKFFAEIALFFKNLFFVAPFKAPEAWNVEEPKPPEDKVFRPSPGETDILKAIENKSSKFGFETLIRFIYIDRKDSFTQANVSAVSGAFKQFGTQNLNSFRPDKETITTVTKSRFTTKSWFRDSKIYARKRDIYDSYRKRKFSGSDPSILNTEELATVFHFPITVVESPRLSRLGTRKGEAPSNLPIIE